MPNCPGSCNASYRAAAARYQAEVAAHARLIAALAEGEEPPDPPRPPGIEPEPGEPVWCVRCAGRIRRQLAELDDLAALTAARPPAPRADKPDDGAGRVSGSREPPSPSPAGDTLEELAGWARDWEAVVRGIEPLARRGFLATQLTTSFAHLIALFDKAITAPDYAADLGAEIRRWHRDLSGLAGAGQAARHKPKPCPRCRKYTLWETTGKDHIWCSDTDCGRLLTREEYAALDASLRVRAPRRPVPAAPVSVAAARCGDTQAKADHHHSACAADHREPSRRSSEPLPGCPGSQRPHAVQHKRDEGE